MYFYKLTTFTLEELEALLEGRSEDTIYKKEASSSLNITSSSQGPGYLNKWRLLERNENVWEKLQPTEIKKNRPTVILSHSRLYTNRMAYAILLTALKEHCTVKVWSKEPRLLSELLSLESTEFNLDHLDDIKVTSKITIEAALAEQGLDIHEYHIIDDIELQKLIFKLTDPINEKFPDTKEGYYLNFQAMADELTSSQTNDLLEHGIDFEKLKFVTPNHYNDISRIPSRYLPKITIIINDPSFEELSFYLALPIAGISIYQLDFTNFETPVNQINLVGNIKSIKIESGKFKILDLTQLIHLEEINISKILTLEEIVAPNNNHLIEFTCTDCPNVATIKHPPNQFIDKLTLVRCGQDNANYTTKPIVTHKFISHFSAPTLQPYFSKTLDTFEVAVSRVFSNTASLSQTALEALPKLSSLKLINSSIPELDLSSHTNLSVIELQNLHNIKEIILPPNIKLDKIALIKINKEVVFKNRLSATEVYIEKNINFLDLLPKDQIERLALSGIHVANLDLTTLTSAKKIMLDGKLSSLILPSSLEFLFVNNTNDDSEAITNVDLSRCDHLTHLSIPSLDVKRIEFSEKAKIKMLALAGSDNIELVNFPKKTLERLHFNNIHLTEIPTYSSDSLRFLDINYLDTTDLSTEEIEDYQFNEIFPNLAAIRLGIDTKKTQILHNNKLKHTTLHFDNLSENNDSIDIPVTLKSNYAQSELVTLKFDPQKGYECFTDDLTPILKYKSSYPGIKVINLEGFEHPINFNANHFPNLLNYNLVNCSFEFHANSENDHNNSLSLQHRKTSRYQVETSLDIDNKTDDNNSDYEAEGELYCELIAREPIPITHLRINYFDRFFYDEINQLKIGHIDIEEKFNHAHNQSLNQKIQAFDKNVIEALEKKVKHASANETLGYFHGRIKPHTWYILPVDSETELDSYKNLFIYSENIDHIDQYIKVAWSKKLKQAAFFYLPNDEDDGEFINIDIYYHIKQGTNYRKTTLLDEEIDIIQTDKKLLPIELENNLQHLVKNHTTLSKLLDLNTPTHELVKLIFEYCSTSTSTKFKNGQNDKTSTLLEIIFEIKVACRHRAYACMALLHFIGVKSRIVVNEIHAFVEIYYHKEGKKSLLCLDLGGAVTNDLTNEEEFNFEKPAGITDEDSSDDIPTIDSTFLKIEENEKYSELFKKYAVQSTIDETSILFEKSRLAPLLKISDEAEALKVDNLLLRDVSNNMPDTSYYYIHNPKELKQFFDSAFFTQVGLKLNRESGELASAINKKSVIVINLITFNAAEIAAFKSCVDTERKLFGMPISNDVNIILLISDNTPACAALYSRCKKFSLSSDLLANNHQTSVSVPDIMMTDELELDFLNYPFWQQILFGEIKFAGDKINVIESSLIKAIREGQPITLYNLPKNNELGYIIHRLQTHNHLFYNGAFLAAVPGFSLKIATRSHPLEAKNVFIHNKPLANKDKIIIGMHNIHLLYSQLYVKPPYGFDKDGLLASYNPNKQVFYIANSISEDHLAYLIHTIETQYSNKEFNFCLAPGVTMGNIIGIASPSKQRADAIYTSNDPIYLAEKLSKHNTPIFVNKLTTFSDLIYDISIIAGEKIKFLSHTHDIATALQNKHIVLVGDISEQLAIELSTLLEKQPYYMNSENKRVNLNGKLTLVISNKHSLLFDKIKNINYHIDDYPWDNDELVYVDKIKRFYQLANKALSTNLPISYHLLKTMIARLKAPTLHLHNPIKGLILHNYPKNSNEYALLNIIAKYIFTPDIQAPINQARLSTLINQLKSKNNELNLDQNYYRILNCFAGKALKFIIGEDIEGIFDHATRPTDTNNRLLDTIDNFYQSKPALIRHKNPIDQLEMLLDQDLPLIILKGPPGVGKSHSIRQIQYIRSDIDVLEGLNSIEAWLTSPTEGKTKLLLLDEANMAQPGTWDFLTGLSLDRKTIFYKGKLHQLDNLHKIIAAVNPEDYPGRYQHAYFQHYGETLYFKPGDKQFLEQSIIGNILSANKLNPKEAEFFYEIYELYIQHQPYRAISIRDLVAFTSRVCALITKDIRASQALYLASICDFAFSISDPDKQKDFIKNVEDLFNSKNVYFTSLPKVMSLEKFSEDFYLPTSRFLLAKLIEQSVILCDFACTQPKNTLVFKSGMLLEGDSGIGKSTLYLKILTNLGYTDNHLDAKKRFYHCSALDTNVIEILTTAFHDGSKVILDELDLNPGLEHCLNQFLSGVDLKGETANHPGFMLLASQNGVQFTGRSSIPYALANRFHYININKLSDKELVLIAERIVPDPEAFVFSYRQAQQNNPGSVNMRSFYNALHELEHGLKRKFNNDEDGSDDNLFKKRQRSELTSNSDIQNHAYNKIR